MRVLVVIPARGGSKGLPGKNLRTVAGISLVGRAVRAAQEFIRTSALPESRIMVDTDSPEIAHEAAAWGIDVPFLREAELAGDETSTVDSTLGLLDHLAAIGERYDALLLLQPTSPLRDAGEILNTWQTFIAGGGTSATTICPIDHPVELALRINGDGTVAWREPLAGPSRRQYFEPSYRLTGSVYAISTTLLRDKRTFTIEGVTRGVVVKGATAVDVDSADDLAVAERLAGAAETTSLALIGHRIGGGAPCFVIAEAGVNHNGDIGLAHLLVDAAADAGADAVKFQIFDPALLVSVVAPKAEYQVTQTGEAESQLEMLRGLTLEHAEFRSLARHAAERGILFLATAFDVPSADFLDELEVSALKVPSGEVTNHPFLANLARRGKPLLMSTGMSDMVEVARAVDVIRENGAPSLALFHCVTEYPAPPAECNLRAMETMRRAFGVPVGWSDHTAGLAISLAAVAMGAEVLEKHFTLDRTLPGPDHSSSLEPSELADLVRHAREVHAARGDGEKRPAPSERGNAGLVRRSLHAVRDLEISHAIGEEDLISLRPATGISPADLPRVLGRRLGERVAAGQPLQWTHLG
jgi:N-acetylneuraminate synthase/N,N'-diacetyllegionaminate synthase